MRTCPHHHTSLSTFRAKPWADNSSDCVLDLELDYASSQDDVQANVEVGAEKNNKKLTVAQQDTLNFYYSSALISRAALESSLTITLVKVIEQGS